MKLTLTVLFCTALSFCKSQTIPFRESFDNADIASRGWYDNKNIAISKTEHIPGSTGSAEFHWLKGATTPVSGSAARKMFSPSDSVYADFWVKYSAGYTGSNHPYHPHEFLILTTEDDTFAGPAYTHLTAYIEQNEGVPMVGLQDGMNIDNARLKTDLTEVTEKRAVCGCNGIREEEQATYVDCYRVTDKMYWNGKDWKADQPYFRDTPGPYYQNNWHHIVAYFKLNTITQQKGNPDGVIRYWYDNRMIIEKTNIIMRTGEHPGMKFNQFIIAPYIGDGSPVDQTFWIDNLVLSIFRTRGEDMK